LLLHRALSAGARLGVARRRRRWLAGGALVLALELETKGGRGFPVAKRARTDAKLGRDLLLCHPLGEQLRRPLLLSSPLLSAAALVRALLLRPRPHPSDPVSA